jgi:hypothetical protein
LFFFFDLILFKNFILAFFSTYFLKILYIHSFLYSYSFDVSCFKRQNNLSPSAAYLKLVFSFNLLSFTHYLYWAYREFCALILSLQSSRVFVEVEVRFSYIHMFDFIMAFEDGKLKLLHENSFNIYEYFSFKAWVYCCFFDLSFAYRVD